MTPLISSPYRPANSTEADKGHTLSLPLCRFHSLAFTLSLPSCRVKAKKGGGGGGNCLLGLSLIVLLVFKEAVSTFNWHCCIFSYFHFTFCTPPPPTPLFQVVASTLSLPRFRFRVPLRVVLPEDRCLTFADCTLQTAHCRLQTADHRLQTADNRLQTVE